MRGVVLVLMACAGVAVGWLSYAQTTDEMARVIDINAANMQANWYSLVIQFLGFGGVVAVIAMLVSVSRKLGEAMTVLSRVVLDERDTRAIVDEHCADIAFLKGLAKRSP